MDADEGLAGSIDADPAWSAGGGPPILLHNMLQEIATLRAQLAAAHAREDRLRAVLEWYADPKHWIDAVLLLGESKEFGEITGNLIARGHMPGEWGLAPHCMCGQCNDYWHADNGERARAALADAGREVA